ncbi:uncharacterized protein J3D65DRAFT_701227 [Phyllosticta citribraziliensis]|uniref:Uncharacterized protein n=1 Tax=Phyllosticta citribraziliensis TaxID=989973 RepID=A0ABR1LGM3_9PEZI
MTRPPKMKAIEDLKAKLLSEISESQDLLNYALSEVVKYGYEKDFQPKTQAHLRARAMAENPPQQLQKALDLVDNGLFFGAPDPIGMMAKRCKGTNLNFRLILSKAVDAKKNEEKARMAAGTCDDPVDLTDPPPSPVILEVEVKHKREEDVIISICRVLVINAATHAPIYGGPKFLDNSCHIDTLLKLGSVLGLHTMETERVTNLGTMFALFSQLDLSPESRVDGLRDDIRNTAYNHETGAEPGKYFTIATAWEKVASQFNETRISSSRLTWCKSCGWRAPSPMIQCSAILEPVSFYGPTSLQAGLEETFGQRNTDKTCEGCESPSMTSAQVPDTGPPEYLTLGEWADPFLNELLLGGVSVQVLNLDLQETRQLQGQGGRRILSKALRIVVVR